MPLINTSVPNLIQGVSQQPDAVRFDGQCEEQVNALSSVVDGLIKRPNTRHIGRLLTSAISQDSFVHFINRSEDERYVVIHDGTTIRAFNVIDGVEASIDGVTGGYTPASGSYLDAADPREALKALTVADSTFILNTNVGVGYKKDNGAVKYTPAIANRALIFVKQASSQVKYGVTLTGGLVSGSGATATVTLTRYLYSYNWRYQTRVYRWRVSAVNVTNGGSGYIDDDNITFNLTSNRDIYSQPSITFNVTNGVINTGTTHTINNGGDFEGAGGFGKNIGTSSPTVTMSSIVSPPAEVGSSSTSDAFITSASISSHPEDVQADVILTSLIGDVANSDKDIQTVFSTEYNYKQNPDTNLIEIERHDGGDFHITAIDGTGGGRIGVVYKEVGSISDLPLIAPHGFCVKVRGDTSLNEDDYYVRFETIQGSTTTTTDNTNANAQGTGVPAGNITSTVGEGTWVETVAPEIIAGVEPSTMFHTLKNTGVNEFVIEETLIAERLVGNDASNPLPSFESLTVSNLFFFKNRLGLLSAENVIMTESGLGTLNSAGRMVFNFGRTTVRTLLDGDPVDVSVSSRRVTDLRAAIAFQENLIMFSSEAQFVLKGGDVLSPSSVSITPVTNFEYDADVDPVGLGAYLYFPFKRNKFLGLREYTVNSTSDVYDSTEVTEHLPRYVPETILSLTGSTTEEMVAAVCEEEAGSIFIYKYFYSNSKKLLSSWSKFTLDGEIRGLEFFESTLHIVLVKNGETHLLHLPLNSRITDEGVNYTTHLDMRVPAAVGNGDTTIDLTNLYTADVNKLEVYQTDGTKLASTNTSTTVTLSSPFAGTRTTVDVEDLVVGKTYIIASVGDTDWTTVGATASTLGLEFVASAQGIGTGTVYEPNVWVGIPYKMLYTFSEQIFKTAVGQSKSPSGATRLLIRNGSLRYDESSQFTIKVTAEGRTTRSLAFSTNVVSGALELKDGFFRFPVFTKPEGTTITIENETALPSNFSSAEFESFAHARSNRVP